MKMAVKVLVAFTALSLMAKSNSAEQVYWASLPQVNRRLRCKDGRC